MKNPLTRFKKNKLPKLPKPQVVPVEIQLDSFQFLVTIKPNGDARVDKLLPDSKISLADMVKGLGSLRDAFLKEIHRQEFLADYDPQPQKPEA